MILNFDNIGGIRFVPYGESAQRLYGLRTSGDTETKYLGGKYKIECCFAGTLDGIACGMIFPGYSEPGKPILNVSGRIYIDGVHILTNPTSESFAVGGYLGTGTDTTTFELYDGTSIADTATFSRSHLFVIPAAYSGGLRVSGLNDPGNTLDPGQSGKENSARIATANNNAIFLRNMVFDYRYLPNLNVRYTLCGTVEKNARYVITPT